MNPEKFTQKSLEAIQEAQNVAVRNQNSSIEQVHLLSALLTQESGLIPQIFTRMTVDARDLLSRVDRVIAGLPKVSGNVQQYISQALNQALVDAEDQANRMQDEYVSVEHLVMALLDKPDRDMKEIWSAFGINKKDFQAACMAIRGNAKVTNQTPEETYDVLTKYGQDLVERARENKLDP